MFEAFFAARRAIRTMRNGIHAPRLTVIDYTGVWLSAGRHASNRINGFGWEDRECGSPIAGEARRPAYGFYSTLIRQKLRRGFRELRIERLRLVFTPCPRRSIRMLNTASLE